MTSQVEADEIEIGRDGFYAVCFKNYHGKSREEIMEVFEKFGKVHSLRFAGQDLNGMVFVRYKEYEETKRCLEELRKKKEFNVRIAHPNGRTKDDNNGNKFRQQSNDHRYFQKKPDEYNSSRFNENSNMNSGKDNFQRRNTQQEENENLDHGNRNRRFGKDSDTRSQKSNSSSKHNGSVSDGPPPLINADELPPLLDTTDIPALVDKTKVKAVDVILANFPKDVDLVQIHCLLKKYGINNVIKISEIETTGIKFNIQYCHLWLNNLFDADRAEFVLNGLDFCGRKLVAVKTDTLLNDN